MVHSHNSLLEMCNDQVGLLPLQDISAAVDGWWEAFVVVIVLSSIHSHGEGSEACVLHHGSES